MLTAGQSERVYRWPYQPLGGPEWSLDPEDGSWSRSMPEPDEAVARDSRWPAFFPSPISLVTTGEGEDGALEKVVGASIVNRFPYVVALSFCREQLSDRHYARTEFCRRLERSGTANVQFLPVGDALDHVMQVIGSVPDRSVGLRIDATRLSTRQGETNAAPVFDSAYMVYEAELVRPMQDADGRKLFERPWVDVGSHRIYFLEIKAIQLRLDIASGDTQIRWRSLPEFSPREPVGQPHDDGVDGPGYRKAYVPNYRFPAAGTTAFHWEYVNNDMAVKLLDDGVLYDNDAARWPCFFPQSAGFITSTSPDGVHNAMPCGSTTIVSRQPLVVAPCISYAAINERYAPRVSLDHILKTGRFGCGVPFIEDTVVDAIRYAGNTSLSHDVHKLSHTGLRTDLRGDVPVLLDLPVFLECRVVDAVYLGTHVMLLGEATKIRVRPDVSTENPLVWCPWPDVESPDPTGRSGTRTLLAPAKG